MPLVGVVYDARHFVGCNLEAVYCPVQRCFAVDFVFVCFVGDAFDAASVVDVENGLVRDEFPFGIAYLSPAHGAVDAVEVGVIGVACCDDLQWPGLACFVTEVQVDQLLAGFLECPEVGCERDARQVFAEFTRVFVLASRARGARRRGMPRCRLW